MFDRICRWHGPIISNEHQWAIATIGWLSIFDIVHILYHFDDIHRMYGIFHDGCDAARNGIIFRTSMVDLVRGAIWPDVSDGQYPSVSQIGRRSDGNISRSGTNFGGFAHRHVWPVSRAASIDRMDSNSGDHRRFMRCFWRRMVFESQAGDDEILFKSELVVLADFGDFHGCMQCSANRRERAARAYS